MTSICLKSYKNQDLLLHMMMSVQFWYLIMHDFILTPSNLLQGQLIQGIEVEQWAKLEQKAVKIHSLLNKLFLRSVNGGHSGKMVIVNEV